METGQKTWVYHDDRQAQLLLERIKEKMVRNTPIREKALALSQGSQVDQEKKQCCN
jgi:hypothetical protein